MRISDWSSDVCSSDLVERLLARVRQYPFGDVLDLDQARHVLPDLARDRRVGQLGVAQLARPRPPLARGPEHALGIRRRLVVVRVLAVHPDEMGGEHGTGQVVGRSEEHTSELQSLMRNSYAVFCLKKKSKAH